MPRPRYAVDDVVELYPEPTHEYPHPDDQFAQTPVVIIAAVITHPQNDEWVQRYTVRELDENGEPTARIYDVLPGTIARPHTS